MRLLWLSEEINSVPGLTVTTSGRTQSASYDVADDVVAADAGVGTSSLGLSARAATQAYFQAHISLEEAPPMHALVTKVHVERDDPEDRRNLTENVAPMVAKSPGFVAGYWLEAGDDGESISVVVFDSEGSAQAGAEMAKGFFASDQAPRAVRLKSAEVRGVAANS